MSTIAENIQPLVSVLVVTYNQEEYIAETLDSIISQECEFDFEILLGEDCSTDKTRDICIEYSKRFPDKIRLFLNDSNKGFIENYFSLIPEIRGKYIADCGGDDYWTDRKKLSKQIEILESHNDVGMVCSDWAELISETNTLNRCTSGRKADYYNPQEFGNEYIINYLNGLYPRVVLSSACFRADWLKESMKTKPELFDTKTIVCEDLPITICMLSNGPIYYMKEEFLVYRVLKKSVSHSDRDSYIKGFAWSVFKQTCMLIKSYNLSFTLTAKYLSNKTEDFIYHSFVKQDRIFLSEIKTFTYENGISLNFKMHLIVFITNSRLLSGVVLTIREILKLQKNEKG